MSDSMKQRLISILPVIVLILVTVVIYNKPILKGRMIYGQDIIQQSYPLTEFKKQCFRMGTLPLWNPYMMSGMPQYASAPFYPTDLLVLITSPANAGNWRFISHTFLAALFMFLFLRHIGLTRASGLLGASAFGFSGFFMSKLFAGHPGAFNSGIWIPFIFLFLDKLIQHGKLRYAISLGAIIGIQILGEHAQYAYYTLIAALAFTLWRLWPVVFKQRDIGRVLRTGILGVISAVMAFALSAAYLLPMLEITKLSTRSGGTDYKYATSLSLPPLYAISAFAANIWGSPVRHNSVFGAAYWDGSLYIGLVPLLLAIYAAIVARGQYAGFFRLLALVAFVFSLGKHTPIYGLVYHLPGFSMMRAPSKILYLYTFAMAALSAIGLDSLRFSAKSIKWFPSATIAGAALGIASVLEFIVLRPVIIAHARRAIFDGHLNPALAITKLNGLYSTQLESLGLMAVYLTVFAGLAWLFVRNIKYRRLASIGIVALTLIDLSIFAQELVSVTDPSQVFSFNSTQVDYLKQDHDLFRIMPVEESTFSFAQGVLTGLQSVNGYYPVTMRSYAVFEGAVDKEPPSVDVCAKISNCNSPLINLLNVKYILTRSKIHNRNLDLVKPGEINIYKNRNVLPRAMIVHGSVSVNSPEDALNRIQKPDFDPKRELVLVGESSPTVPAAADNGEFARVTLYQPLKVVVDANLRKQGYLLLSEKYYPAWHAYIDGRPAKILAANYIFRAVELQPGHHIVRFVYESRGRMIGEKLTYSAIIVFLMLVLFVVIEPLFRCKRIALLPLVRL